jgi:branched-chain amino acid aminotransferase
MSFLDIQINKVKSTRIGELDIDNIVFGRQFSDHMFIAEYMDGGWKSAKIMPYGPLSLMPATSVLHYGQSNFEGMKAHLSPKGEVILFRPEKNIQRFNKSNTRMSIPEVPEDLFMDGLKKLIEMDKAWVPAKEGCSLYIRPFIIATEPYIGVKTSDRYSFIIITCPVGSYYDQPVSVWVEEHFARSVKGGVGDAKTAGNYARTLYPVEEARKKGYKDILWLDGVHKKYIEEVGTMNIFFVIDGVVTTPELDGTFLEGVTRDSILHLAADMGLPISEKRMSIDEVTEAHDKGLLQEMFGTGTAATITHISKFCYKDKEYLLNPDSNKIATQLKEKLEAIKTNKIADAYNWLVKI